MQTGVGGAKTNAAPVSDVSPGAPIIAVWPSDDRATLVPKNPNPTSPEPVQPLLLALHTPAERVKRYAAPIMFESSVGADQSGVAV